ncbi:hypothetical protein GCM10027053_52190 [Intrasporangium mesophilum]
MSTKTQVFIDEAVRRAEQEILDDITAGIVPSTVATFSALHDHVDANEYGGLTEDDAPERFGVEACNTVQDKVDEWLRAGRPNVARFESGVTRVLHPNLIERVQGLSDEGRVVVDDGYGYLFGLTLCCDAYDKGSVGGACCRACYGDDAGEYDAVVVDPIVREESK